MGGAEKGEEGEGRIFRRLEAVLLNLTMKYNSCHQRSTTPVVNEVLLLSSMKYYSCFYTTFLVVDKHIPLPDIYSPMRMQGLFGRPTSFFPAAIPTNRLKNLHMLGKTPNFVLTYLYI